MSRKVTSKDDFQTRLTGVMESQTAPRDDPLVAGGIQRDVVEGSGIRVEHQEFL